MYRCQSEYTTVLLPPYDYVLYLSRGNLHLPLVLYLYIQPTLNYNQLSWTHVGSATRRKPHITTAMCDNIDARVFGCVAVLDWE